jgi:Ala-tRNA(Pro) deacylase
MENVRVEALDLTDPTAFEWCREESLDTVLCSNVIEHIEDDAAVLRHFHELLEAGGHCIGMAIWAGDVSVSNYMCENAYKGIEVRTAGPTPDPIRNVALSNIRINRALGADGTGMGIYWAAGLDSGHSQLGPFHITNCDRGFHVEGQGLRGAGFISGCTRGLDFDTSTVAITAQEVAESEHVPGKDVAKTVIVIAEDRAVMVLVPATRRLQFSRLAGALGASQVLLADEEELETLFPDCEIGAMPPFGNLYGIDVYVDRPLTEDERIVFRAGTHTDTISMKYVYFARLVEPTIVEVSFHPSAV